MTTIETRRNQFARQIDTSAGTPSAERIPLEAGRGSRTEPAPRHGAAAFPSGHVTATDELIFKGVSESEITQSVIYALTRALAALRETYPETTLNLSACEARRRMRAFFGAVAAGQAHDAALQSDYHEAILFQNMSSDLALEIVAAVQRYVRARERAL